MEEKLNLTPEKEYEEFDTSDIIDSKKMSQSNNIFSLNQFIKFILVTFVILCFCLILFNFIQKNSPNFIQSPIESNPTSNKCKVGYKNEGDKCVIDYAIKASYFTKQDNEQINLMSFVPDFPIQMIIDGELVESTKSFTFPKKGEHKVLIKSNFTKLTSTKRWFYKISNLLNLEFTPLFESKNVKDMKAIFYECSELTSIDLSHFDTTNVVNMELMFAGCRKLINGEYV